MAKELTNIDYLYSTNTVLVFGKIDTETVEPIAKQLLALYHSKGNSPIHILIDSPGGCEYKGMMLVELLLAMKRPVVTYGIGEVGSAAIDIFLAGDKRICTKRTLFMVHEYDLPFEGKSHELLAAHGIQKWMCRRDCNYYKERAGDAVAELLLKKSNQWLTPQQAKRLGIVHKIVKCVNIPRVIGKTLSMENGE